MIKAKTHYFYVILYAQLFDFGEIRVVEGARLESVNAESVSRVRIPFSQAN